jgi:hypothetical protein
MKYKQPFKFIPCIGVVQPRENSKVERIAGNGIYCHRANKTPNKLGNYENMALEKPLHAHVLT